MRLKVDAIGENDLLVRCILGVTEHKRDLVEHMRPQWETLVRGLRYTLRHFRSGLRTLGIHLKYISSN